MLILKGERQALFFGILIKWKSNEQSYGERETDDKSNDLLGIKHCKITARTTRNLGQFWYLNESVDGFPNYCKNEHDKHVRAGLLDSKGRGCEKRKA